MTKRNKQDIKDIVTLIYFDLYNHLLPCGARSIRKQMTVMDVSQLLSISTIYRIQRDNYLTHGRAGYPDDI